MDVVDILREGVGVALKLGAPLWGSWWLFFRL